MSIKSTIIYILYAKEYNLFQRNNNSQNNIFYTTFGCHKSLLRQSYLLLMLPYVPKIKVLQKVKFQREFHLLQRNAQKNFRISLCDCHKRIFVYHYVIATKEFSYITHIKDIIRVQKKIISTIDIPNSFRLRASKRK